MISAMVRVPFLSVRQPDPETAAADQIRLRSTWSDACEFPIRFGRRYPAAGQSTGRDRTIRTQFDDPGQPPETQYFVPGAWLVRPLITRPDRVAMSGVQGNVSSCKRASGGSACKHAIDEL